MQPYNPYLPPELYVWIVTQDGEDRIRKWDVKPFDDATHICKQNTEKLTDQTERVKKTTECLRQLKLVEPHLKGAGIGGAELGVICADHFDTIVEALSQYRDN